MNGDFSSKLDALLSNPAMMAQIKALADTMTSAGAIEVPPPTEEAVSSPSEEPQLSPEESTPAETATVLPATGGLPPAAMPTLFSPPPGGPPPALEANIRNTRALLSALKPYLDDRRRDKIDKMLNMMRLAEMAGYFRNLL